MVKKCVVTSEFIDNETWRGKRRFCCATRKKMSLEKENVVRKKKEKVI